MEMNAANKHRRLHGGFAKALVCCRSWLACIGCALALWLQADSAVVTAPPNDNFDSAIEVSGAEFKITGDLGAATSETFELVSPNRGHTAWWVWTSPDRGIYEWTVAGGATPATAVSVYLQDGFGQLLEKASTHFTPSINNNALIPDSSGSFQAEKGYRYFIRLDLASPVYFGFYIPPFEPYPPVSEPVAVQFAKSKSAAPPNDSFANSTELTGEHAVFAANLAAATSEPGEPVISPKLMHRTAWWTWKSPSFGSAVIRCPGTNAPPVAGIYMRRSLQALQLIATSATEMGNTCYSFPAAHNQVEWDAVPDARYEIQLDCAPGYDLSSTNILELVFTPAPANDIPQNAIPIEGVDVSWSASTQSATLRTNELIIPTQTGSNSVWFLWTAPSSGIVQIGKNPAVRYDDPNFVPDTTTGVVIVHTLPPCSGPFEDLHPPLPFVPVFGLYTQSGQSLPRTPDTLVTFGTNSLIAEVQSGRDYWIALDGDKNTAGETPAYLLLIAPPSNDLFASRISLPAKSVRVKGRTFAATKETSDPLVPPHNQALPRSVWWEWQAPLAGRWMLFVVKGQYDHQFVLYRGSIPQDANTAGSTQNSPILFDCQTGETVQIGVFALGGLGGNVEFTITPVTSPELRIVSWRDYTPWGGRFLNLQLPDNSGLPYVLDRSEDLANWTPVLTNANAWSHLLQIQSESGKSSEFYRARLLP